MKLNVEGKQCVIGINLIAVQDKFGIYIFVDLEWFTVLGAEDRSLLNRV